MIGRNVVKMEERNQPSFEDIESIRVILLSKLNKLEDEISSCCRQILRISDIACNQNLKIQAIHQYLWNTDPEFRKLCVVKSEKE